MRFEAIFIPKTIANFPKMVYNYRKSGEKWNCVEESGRKSAFIPMKGSEKIVQWRIQTHY